MAISIRVKLILLGGLALLVLAAVFAFSAYMVQNETSGRLRAAIASGDLSLFRQLIVSNLDHMEANMKTLTRDADTIKALNAADAAAVRESAATSYRLLSASGVISSMLVTDLEGSILFHSEEQGPSGKASFKLLLSAMADTKVKRGLERGGKGALDAVLSFPLYHRGKPVGAVAFIKHLDEALKGFKAASGADAAMMAPSGTMERSTDKKLFAAVEGSGGSVDGVDQRMEKIEDRFYLITAQTVQDHSNAPAGVLVSAKDVTEARERENSIRITAASIAAGAIILSLLAVYFVISRSLKPLNNLKDTMEGIEAESDLTKRIEIHAMDEVGITADSFNRMLGRFQEIINEVSKVTESLASAAEEMNHISTATAQKAAHQRRDTEQLAASVTQMTATIHEVAKTASVAEEVSRDASRQAGDGKAKTSAAIDAVRVLSGEVKSAADAIGRLKENTGEVGVISKVISDIAFQTNLLALNASIEAARAGKHGKGFAVVADEIRSLAQRTQKSISKINGIIESFQREAGVAADMMSSSGKHVEETTSQARAVGDSLDAIEKAVGSIADMNIKIANATDEQNSAAEEIEKAVSNIDKLSAETALEAENASASSSDQAQLAEKLNSLVSQFKV